MKVFALWRRWAALPRGMRRAGALAAVTVVAASALLYQTNVRSGRPPVFSRGGAFAPELGDPTLDLGTPIPAGGNRSAPLDRRTQAVVTVPQTEDDFGGDGSDGGGTSDGDDNGTQAPTPAPVTPKPPRLGVYTYEVDGYEEATGFPRRDYPDTMTITVHRTQPTEPGVPKLKSNEVILDYVFSDEHKEREIVAYPSRGPAFTFEGGSITFGPVTQTSEATYSPAMLQVPFPLADGAKQTGTSQAKSSDGTVVRTEDWADEILGRETVRAAADVDAWVVQVQRKSRPGSSDQVDRQRVYWFDPGRMIWAKLHERFTGERALPVGTFTYHTEFTATLVRFDPLS